MFEIYVKLQLRVFPFGHCSIRRKRQSKQFMPDLTLFCSLAVRPTLRMRNIVFALHPGRKAYKFIFSYFIFIQSGCLCNKKCPMHTRTHTRKHILFITIPETTPAEHKVRNSIEKLSAELCSFFFFCCDLCCVQ